MGSLPHIVEDFVGFLQLYSDGSIHRNNDIKFKDSIVEDTSVIFKDSLFNQSFNLYLRIFKPQIPSSDSDDDPTKMPLLIFFHGGGFCFGSRTWPHIHNCCVRLASGLRAVVVAPDYRLSPEHRLPAALEDAVEAVRWVQRGEDAWLNSGDVDFDRVFIMGDSSGGNIAHHLAVRFGSEPRDLDPIRVRGYILLAPFFGGEVRTESEEGPREEVLTLEILDRFWRLSIPVGKNRDHPLVNPFGGESEDVGPLKLEPILVMVGGRELLKDRAKYYAEKLKEEGKNIEYVEFEGRQHGFFSHDSYSDVAQDTLQIIQRFMLHNSI